MPKDKDKTTKHSWREIKTIQTKLGSSMNQKSMVYQIITAIIILLIGGLVFPPYCLFATQY